MKRNHLLVLSALVAGLQIAVAQASPFPADAEASHDLVALESHADRQAGNGDERMVTAGFPADAEASYNLAASDSYAEQQARTGGDVWGVSPRQPHDPFPFSSGCITD